MYLGAGRAGSAPGTSTEPISQLAEERAPAGWSRFRRGTTRLVQRLVPFGGHLIAGLYRTARSIESTARQRQSLVTLGTLAAGIAHEINNPASAASRAVDGLDMEFRSLLLSASQLAQKNISPEQFAELDARSELQPADLDPLARADREQELVTWLNRNRVARAWIIAPQLAAAGVDLAWCARAAAILEGSALEPGLEWVASTFSVATLLSEAKESTRRIAELVAAVRSYTQMDRASMQRIDVTDGLNSTLVMLGHRLRGVTVVREYGTEVPMIDAYAGELNQVWTNLIDNAVDAMGEAGTLRIATRVEDGEVVIEIADTGPVCRRRWRRARSSPFTARTSAKAPASALTLRVALWSSVIAARSASTPDRVRPYCGSGFQLVGLSRSDRDYSPARRSHHCAMFVPVRVPPL